MSHKHKMLLAAAVVVVLGAGAVSYPELKGSFSTKSINVDNDGDGLSAFKEKALGTSDGKKDSDGDRVEDGLEVSAGSDPAVYEKDIDEDGLYNYQEIDLYFTDALEEDTDEDGLTDGEEVITYGTDPLNEDSDDDGVTDGRESRE